MKPNNNETAYNHEDLRSDGEKSIYEHGEHIIDGLITAENRLADLERKLTERLLKGDGVRAKEVRSRLASLLGKKVTKEFEEISTKELQKDIQEEIENDPYLQALYSHKFSNVSSAVRDMHALDRSLDGAETLQAEVEAEIYRSDVTDISLREALDEIKQTILDLHNDKRKLSYSSEEAYYVCRMINLRSLKKQSKEGAIIETSSVHEKRLQIEGFALSGRPIFLHGAPGTGKTEMAMHVANHLPTAKEFLDKDKYESKNKEKAQPFMIISASKQTDSSELTGHQVINVKQMPEDERKKFIDNIEKEMSEWESNHVDATEDQKIRQQQIILEAYKLTHGQGMETSFWTGPMYKCMEEGIPFIVDEANAMPPDVLIKINHLMTRRPGDEVIVQEDSGKKITIKQGFCFIFTGNIGEQFQGRYRLEQSFVNRIGDAMIEYNYLPEHELKEVMIAYLMEGSKAKGSVVMSEEDMVELLNFATASSFAQRVFAGKEDILIPDGSGGTLSVRDHKLLKNTPLSMRNIFNVIDAYKKDGANLFFEQYIYDSFIKPIQDKGERYVYFQIFKANGFFIQSINEELVRDSNGKVIEFEANDIDDVIKGDKSHVFTPRDTINKLYGVHDTGRRDYQEVKVEGVEEMSEEEKKFHNLLGEIDNFLTDLDDGLNVKMSLEKKKETTDLEQDLTDLTQVEPFTLKNHPINPKQVFEAKEPTDTKAGIWNNDSDFKNWIQPSIQDTTLTSEPVSITSFTLDRNMTGEELKTKLGNAKPFTIDQIATLIDNQSEITGNTPKVTSPLDISDNWNLFLVEKADGSVVVVDAYWDSGGREWDVGARGLAGGWRAGARVFSRND